MVLKHFWRSLKNHVKVSTRPAFALLAAYNDWIIAPVSERKEKINIIPIIELHPPEEIKRAAPMHIKDLHLKFYENAFGITKFTEPTYLEILSHTKVVGYNAAVISKENKIIFRLSPEIGGQLGCHTLLSEFNFRKPFYLKGLSLLVSGPDASYNYFHWMTDALPKIEIALKARFQISDFRHFIVNAVSQPFQIESLAIMKIPVQSLVSLEQNPSIICETLVAPSSTCLSGNVSPWIVNFLRDAFSSWMIKLESLPRKIYISRRNAIKRRISNEAEVAQFLTGQGYVPVFPEELSLKEQVELFYNAESIAGVHGAGFTNFVFCRPGTEVLEFFPDSYVNQCYWTIASINQLKYGYVLGEGVKDSVEDSHLQDCDFAISIKDIHDIQQIFSQSI